jgi:hypothetical protein
MERDRFDMGRRRVNMGRRRDGRFDIPAMVPNVAGERSVRRSCDTWRCVAFAAATRREGHTLVDDRTPVDDGAMSVGNTVTNHAGTNHGWKS